MATQFSSLVLVNLAGGDSFIFRLFPSQITTRGRANWQPQDITVGTKPLFYANREPRELRFDELWLDNTQTGDSLTPEIEQLYRLMEETDKGAPPPLLAQWGDRLERCVLEELTVSEQFFHEDGTPIRALVSMTLLQLQEDAPPPPPVRVNEESSFTF